MPNRDVLTALNKRRQPQWCYFVQTLSWSYNLYW